MTNTQSDSRSHLPTAATAVDVCANPPSINAAESAGMLAASPAEGAAQLDDSEREAMFNGGERGPSSLISRPVMQVAAIRGFMIDIDVDVLDPAVIGEECFADAEKLYERHVRVWLDREPVLSKAEVRFTGGGLHVPAFPATPVDTVAAGDVFNGCLAVALAEGPGGWPPPCDSPPPEPRFP